MSVYEGRRSKAGAIVTVDGEFLDPRHDLANHSPSGLEWGYCGSGPAQLALAILAHHFKDDRRALDLHQRFKWSIVAGLPDAWKLTSNEVERAIQAILRMEKGA